MAACSTGKPTASKWNAEKRPAPLPGPSKTPLTRPTLPTIAGPIDWPGESVAVFGVGALEWARELRPSNAHLVRVELRHAAGFDLQRQADEETTLHAHPDALIDGLLALRERAREITIGVGAPFAVAVRSRRVVWIAGGQPFRSLPLALQPVARSAHLVLEAPRPTTARSLRALL